MTPWYGERAWPPGNGMPPYAGVPTPAQEAHAPPPQPAYQPGRRCGFPRRGRPLLLRVRPRGPCQPVDQLSGTRRSVRSASRRIPSASEEPRAVLAVSGSASWPSIIDGIIIRVATCHIASPWAWRASERSGAGRPGPQCGPGASAGGLTGAHEPDWPVRPHPVCPFPGL